ncbi:uncharacterized protein M421DRAFT_421227 [Didymella exigua CBS 183.55]|uniref:Rhodopsin domain-containing protein n=1 Tax=Didymella exigua CBS 183.55 TaxID=1150837 RepID=A0A6A5RP18_9PLEO|nr:uncharacterized protein M421DRAFT_421227 [Didymella exigua CBS 183.55]KAF1928036.1 hypothetical protein M421DRAFT_421227 [Didymella exigua CBS 183.55]
MAHTDTQLPLPGFIALDWSLMLLALLPTIVRIILRFRARTLPSLAANLSDTFIIFAWVSGCVLICINTWKNTLRMHYLSTAREDLYYGVPVFLSGHLLFVSWISLFFVYISLWSAKAAFLALYYSIFSLQGRRTRIALLCASIFTFLTFVLHIGLIAFWCAPVSANWAPPPGKSLCSAVHSIDSVAISTVANITTDIIILSIPVHALWVRAKQFGRSEKVGLVFVFAMGSVSIIAALVRFVCLAVVQDVPKASITHTIDIWALVEIVSSILAVCAPSCRAFGRSCVGRRGRRLQLGCEERGASERRSNEGDAGKGKTPDEDRESAIVTLNGESEGV